MPLHFAVFMGKAFPGLRRVVVEGSWRRALHDPQLRPHYSALAQRGVSLEFVCDGTVTTLESTQSDVRRDG
jgi:hypothetical protein